jgi:muramidase (phage lysozyme)
MKKGLIVLIPVLFLNSSLEAPEIVSDKRVLMKLRQDIRVKAFLDLLAHGEGTSYHPEVRLTSDEYRVTFCNDGKVSFKDHPRKRCCNPVGNRIICATAAGRYMFLQKTWDWVAGEVLQLKDFSPINQDLAAIFLLIYSGAMHEILKNNIKGAINKASKYWAPMPGNNYNQPQTKQQELLGIYTKRLKFYKSFNQAYDRRACEQKNSHKG